MRNKCVVLIVIIVCLSLSSAADAVVVDANEEWGIKLDDGQSLTCIAHYIPDVEGVPQSLVFETVPEITFTYTAGDWTDWIIAISVDQKALYLYGPANTNNTGYNDVGWFSYKLFFQWDDEDKDLDTDFPVYIDTALYSGGIGSEPFDDFFWKGSPGGTWPDDWEKSEEPYDDSGYYNPIPEPAMIFLLGIGTLFLRKRRKK
jgi:hypothetical protein